MTKVKTLLLTRPEAQSRALAKYIEDRFPKTVRCITSPLLAITPTGKLPNTSDFQALLFTSVNGVEAFITAGGATNRPCYCVGARTAQVARTAGLDAISADGSATELVALVSKNNAADGPLLHVRGTHTAGDVAEKLAALGFDVRTAVLYHQDVCDLHSQATRALADGAVDAVTLYSPRTAQRFAEILQQNPDWPARNLTALCISENVAAEVDNLGLASVQVAQNPNRTEMLSLIDRFLR